MLIGHRPTLFTTTLFLSNSTLHSKLRASLLELNVNGIYQLNEIDPDDFFEEDTDPLSGNGLDDFFGESDLFDEDEDDPLIHIDWECIMGLYYIDGYLEETNPDECFILGIDEDDYRSIESDNCYQWNGLGKDDSLVSKATSLDAALELFEDYISKYAKGRKDKF